EASILGTKVYSGANDQRRCHNGASGLKLPQRCVLQCLPGMQVPLHVTDIERLGSHCWRRENPAEWWLRGEAPPATRLAGRPRQRESPEPELGPEVLELVLPGEFSRIGC